MFNKLRRKFIVLIMTISGIILLATFVLFYVISYVQIVKTNVTMLKNIAQFELDDFTLGNDFTIPDDNKQPFFTTSVIKIEAKYVDNSLIVERKNEFSFIIDDEDLLEIANTAMMIGESVGYCYKYNVRYFIASTDNPNIYNIAICSCEMESQYMSKLMGVCIISLLISLIIVFIVSIFLSKAFTKPTEEAWTQQQQFIANASHELKTPLAVIIANNNILLNHKDEKIGDKEQWIRNTQVEAEQMRSLLNDMLFLAKSDAKLAKEQNSVFNLSELLAFSTLPFDSIAYENNCEIILNICDGVKVKANESEVKSLISIVIDNAVKYSYPGKEILISLKTIKNKAEIKIRNFGPVIDKKEIPLIFERFYRGDESRSKVISGFGLGLSIAKNIVYANKGDIKCESDEQNGTVFTITLPLA